MTDDDAVLPSLEVQLEQVRRDAAGLSDFDLDEHLALVVARRDVAAAHGRARSAEVWNDAAILLADVRTDRATFAREIEEMTGPPPPVVRPLTAEELAEVDPRQSP